MLYLDTSILLAYYCPETFTHAVESLLARTAQPIISPLSEVEFASAVSRKVRMRELGRSDGGRIVSLFQRQIIDGLYSMAPVEPRHFTLARQWLEQFSAPLRTLDALHLAISFSNDAKLVTADRHLADSAKYLGVRCQRIE